MNLAETRRGSGITQKELAALADISQSAVSSYENGTRSPSTAVAQRIAKVLNLSISEMWDMFYEDENRCG